MKKTIEKPKVDISELLIGSDFEMFIVDNNEKIISAIPFNPGTKRDPERLPLEGCCAQRDGVLQECNIPPVKSNEEELFWKNIEYVKSFISGRISENGLKLKCCPSAIVGDDQLLEPEAVELGCDPSYNGWADGDINPKPELKDPNLRSCGFHLHFSAPGLEMYDTIIDMVKLCDLFLGVPSVLLDKDKRRKELYGKAGEFRFQNWGEVQGFEYRVLSNFFIDDKESVYYIFNQIRELFKYYIEQGEEGMKKVNADGELIQKAINHSNEELAEQLCDKYNIHLLIEA